MTRVRRRALVTLCCLAPLPAFPTAAGADTDRVSGGGVEATLSYQEAEVGFRDVRITVTRNGTRLVNEAGPRHPRCNGAGCQYWPLNARVGRRSIFLRNLDRDTEPEVLAEFFTGGANCCLASRIYDFDPRRGAYRRIDRNWNTASHRGARDLDRDGAAEFLSRDSRFKFRYGCNACTPEPVRVFRLREGRLRDVTRRFPALVRRDLRDLGRLYRRVRTDRLVARGVLAALTADRYLLGRAREARRGLRRALRRGELRGTRFDGAPDGRAYIRSLLRFLRRIGYRG